MTVNILNTARADRTWGTAKKTKPVRAKLLSWVFADISCASMFKIVTLEGDEPVGPTSLLCIGEVGEPWQQTTKALLKKYTITDISDDGWMVCTPKPENSVEFFVVQPSDIAEVLTVDKFEQNGIIGQWGADLGDLKNVQFLSVGDTVCRQPHDRSDQWVVRKALWESTYAVTG